MKRFLAVLLLAALAACGSNPHVGALQGDVAPAWSDPLATGGTLSTASLRGKPVYLDFFATWCPPCNVETPWVERFSEQYGHAGLNVIGIDMEENARAANGFRAKYHLTYPVVVDGGTLEDLYNINGLPVHVFIGRNGKIYRKVVGEMSRAEIQDAIRAIVGGRS